MYNDKWHDNLFLDDLVFPVSDEHRINVDEIPEPQNGKLIRVIFEMFNNKDQNDDWQKGAQNDAEMSADEEGGE